LKSGAIWAITQGCASWAEFGSLTWLSLSGAWVRTSASASVDALHRVAQQVGHAFDTTVKLAAPAVLGVEGVQLGQ
jgi:hypothetical protein